MGKSLKEKIINRLPWLFKELGFRVIYDREPSGIGTSVVDLQSDTLQLRFTRSFRYELQVAPPSETGHWYSLETLWLALKGEEPDPDLEGWAWFFREHLAELSDALGPNLARTKVAFERTQKERAEFVAEHLPRRTFAHKFYSFKNTTYGAILMGPIGWIVAACLMVWEVLVR